MAVASLFEEPFFERRSRKNEPKPHQCYFVETAEVGVSKCRDCGKESRWLADMVGAVRGKLKMKPLLTKSGLSEKPVKMVPSKYRPRETPNPMAIRGKTQ